MAADVTSSLVGLMNGADANDSGKSTAPITRDLLGGSCGSRDDSQELDLDLQVPCGWEKRLDLKSGRVYLQRCNSSNSSSSSSSEKRNQTTTTTKFQDLNFPPKHHQSLKNPPTLLEYPSLDLKLDSLSSASSPSSSNYQSVCTLDKVKSALARAEKETDRNKHSRSFSKSSSSPLSNSSSSIKDGDFDQEEKPSSAPVAVGCPRCLMYVLIPKSQPRCPRCNIDIPLPLVASKKPRLDLNISI